MKTSILQQLLESARRICSQFTLSSAICSRAAIAGLLILALTWSMILPFRTQAASDAGPKPKSPVTTESSSSTQATETVYVYGPQRFTLSSAIGSGAALAGLLILPLPWSMILPFRTQAASDAGPKPKSPVTTESSSSTQATETFNVYGPQRFTRLTGQAVNVVQAFSLPAEATAPFNIVVQN